MKKFTFFFVGIFALFLSLNADAQTKTGADYFAGKWNIMVKGTPSGDRKMVFVLEKKDSLITGVVQDENGKELSKITKAEVGANVITLYCTINEHETNFELTKKDDDHATGSVMSMFDVVAERVKETKQ